MGGEVGVVVTHRSGRLAHADFRHPCFFVKTREAGTPHSVVLVEQQKGAIETAVIIQFLRLFQITNAFVETVVLFVQKGRVEPSRGIGRVDLPGLIELMSGADSVAGVAVSFAEIAAQ